MKLFTDNVPVLQSIASTTQTKNKYLINTYASFKQQLEWKEIESFSWIEGKRMAADVLTKKEKAEKGPGEELIDMMTKNTFVHGKSADNLVVWTGEEILLKNPKEKEKSIKI